jgi:hypothetical protein
MYVYFMQFSLAFGERPDNVHLFPSEEASMCNALAESFPANSPLDSQVVSFGRHCEISFCATRFGDVGDDASPFSLQEGRDGI